MTDRPASTVKRPFALILGTCVVGAVVLAWVYGIAALTGNAGGNPICRPAVALAKKVAPYVIGQVAAVNVAKAPLLIPDLAFQDGTGKPVKLDQWRGRTILLNLWATWCLPCRREMPTLDALEARLGGPNFQVVAVNIDTGNPQRPPAFLKKIGVHNLTYYADPSGKVFQDLKKIGRAFGMPTSLLIDPHGCEIGTIAGPAEWSSDDAIKLISKALGQS